MLRSIVGALLALIAVPATAITLTGTHGFGDGDRVIVSPLLDPGTVYRFEMLATQKPARFNAFGEYQTSFNQFTPDGVYYGGNDNPARFDISFDLTNSGATGYFTTPTLPENQYWPNGQVSARFYWTRDPTAWFDVGWDNEAVEWAINISPVPEPATWAMMIVGFGMAGATLRRGRVARTA
jgi:hypothetical protein